MGLNFETTNMFSIFFEDFFNDGFCSISGLMNMKVQLDLCTNKKASTILRLSMLCVMSG